MMARKKKDESAPTPVAEESGGNEKTYQLISKPKLKSLMNTVQKGKIDVAEINGTIGQEILSAIENKHLHRRAFNACKPLMRLEAEQLAEFKAHFDYYWEALGLEAKADSAPSLPLGEDSDDGNVHPFPQTAAE